ncbi:MAG: KUP/HAK/KT family potassium transporter, partial [Austwickia sp.]|nr:KUP/HAK/KT family potassium transporter [Austwickia sp.]
MKAPGPSGLRPPSGCAVILPFSQVKAGRLLGVHPANGSPALRHREGTGARSGTHLVGRFFGPVMVLWFLTLAALGIPHILADPHVLGALSP